MITVVNILGITLIILIIWWFWISKPRSVLHAQGEIEIVVDNGVYTPSRIQVKKGQPVNLRFIRKDASPCAEKVIFSDLGVAEDLPVGKPVSINITPEESGEFSFTCQMQMYRGTLVVTD